MNKKKAVRKKKNKFVKFIKSIPPADFGIIAVTLILIFFGIIMVFSASYYWSMDQSGKPYSFLFKQIVWATMGICLMAGLSIIDYKNFQKYSKPIFWISIVLLLLLFSPLGKETKGATRWLNLGITIMPGEIAKIVAIICTSSFLTRKRRNINDLKTSIMPLLIMCGIYVGLIMAQPNMSTAVTVAAIIISIMFVAGINLKYFTAIGIGGVVGGIALIFVGGTYRIKRVTSFLNPFEDASGDGYQVCQSLIGMGSGGIFGKGLGNGVEKTLYLPEPQNDFILSVIGEELGMIGVLIVFCLFIILIWRGIKVAINAPDKLGFLLSAGVVMMIGLQLLFNIAVVVSAMPPTGVALPFISYGGNSMLVCCSAIGIVLNVSRQTKRKELEEKRNMLKEEKIYFNRGVR